MANCSICGSRFAEKKCYFCQNKVCTSCTVPADVTGSAITVKCMTCDRKGINKISFFAVLKRNKFLLGVIFGFWIFTIFPLPFLQLAGYEASAIVLQPVLFATAILIIPFVFMLFAWQKRAPKEN
ncbi:B-box zinc finger protein [Nitrososphaera viennensis]|uniref:Uncharacterized protein n=2 Tax=Nitrososphaera viennensis TaxID=1034015 RepID=A0A060HIE5_9ARCH|nr:hypothetical protein [Nitrososphaera viennensis]AIC15080.1 hypothetical protein NVIE_008600 [Nitrososphaera viennensis EN76]UVS70007.1 hypothetical protein NWT39_04270 [Nitrososphaera viennensis]